MLLVLDVGNTHTVLGVFGKDPNAEDGASGYELLIANWRVATIPTQTVDEYGDFTDRSQQFRRRS